MTSAKRRHRHPRATADESHRPADGEVRGMRFEVEGDAYAILSIPLSPASRLGDTLTVAEREVVELLLAGRSNAQIAAVRATSARTVANQLGAIYKKLGVTSRRELAALYRGTRGTPP